MAPVTFRNCYAPRELPVPNSSSSKIKPITFYVILCVFCTYGVGFPGQLLAQNDEQSEPKSGYEATVPNPLDAASATQLMQDLTELANSVPADRRTTVLLKFQNDSKVPGKTTFEDALKVARGITSPELRRLKIVTFLDGEITGHSVLAIIASEALLTTREAVIGNAVADELQTDPTILLSYESIAERRGLFPIPIVAALANPGLELAEITRVGGEQEYATTKTLDELRKDGKILKENILSPAGIPLMLDAQRLRTARVSAGIVDTIDQGLELLDLAKVEPLKQSGLLGDPKGAMLEITGAITGGRVQRWQSNLSATLKSGETNTWLIAMDSTGGDLNGSMILAGWFSQPEAPLRTVAANISGEARGDAALVALACKPLLMTPGSTLGGPGSYAITTEGLQPYGELIDQIAIATNRPAALIRGMLDPTTVVYRYTNRKTGRIRYATEQDLILDVDDPELEKAKWNRGEQIQLSEGLDAATAIALGLADGEAASNADAAKRLGLTETPPLVSDRGLVRFVENIGRSTSVAFLLLFVGFIALSAEASSPGLSVPGFIALMCFALFFWMKFLAGTAEWLELVAFTLGLICIGIEIFVLPGVGIFGIGGVLLMILGIVLMSQTFILPQNSFQYQILNRGIWTALAAVLGLIAGVVAMRYALPHVPLFSGLMMEPENETRINEAEKLADYSDLLGCIGVTTTPLRPAGKIRVNEQLVQVVSDGSVISKGQRVKITEVNGTRVVVESQEDA
ncbi:MAG: nodulation protein NfeD [Rhodopirellula sp.]|nr:nodulation protein NfeD [Rhodopirellula sp.]